VKIIKFNHQQTMKLLTELHRTATENNKTWRWGGSTAI